MILGHFKDELEDDGGKLMKVTIESFEESENTGVIDGPEFFLECALCDKKILQIKVLKPDFPRNTNIQTNCPYCNGKSKLTEIGGDFRYYPVGKVKLSNIICNDNNCEVITTK